MHCRICEMGLFKYKPVIQFIFSSYGDELHEKNWLTVNRDLQNDDVSKPLAMIDLFNALPATSVANERAFSQMKLIKGDRRQRLRQDRLSYLMNVRLNAPDTAHFDPIPAVEHWMVSVMIIVSFASETVYKKM